MIIKTLFYILTITFCISIHEIGHYLAGKIFKLRIKHIRIIPPIGGYIRFDDTPSDYIYDKETYLNTCKPWKRIIVYLAGVAANYVCAILLAWSLFCIYNPQHDKTSFIIPAMANVHHSLEYYVHSIQQDITAYVIDTFKSNKENTHPIENTLNKDYPASEKGAYYKSASIFPDTWDIKRLIYLSLRLNILFILFNIIPLPPLDGGNVVLAAYELITRGKTNQKVTNWIYGIGASLLLLLIVYGIAIEIYKDILLPWLI